jgi:glutathione S-transferase
MILYGSSFSPYVRKTLAYAAEKGIALDLQQRGIGAVDADFREASPFAKIPGFRDGDFAISDSTAIITYLEARHPAPPLIPAEPKSRARTVWYEEFADTILIACMGKMFFNQVVAPRFLGRPGDLAVAEKAAKEELPPLIDYIESVMPASGHLVDDRLTLADIAVASPFVNFAHCGVTVDKAKHPKTAAFVDTMLARPSFAPWVEQEKAFLARPARAPA